MRAELDLDDVVTGHPVAEHALEDLRASLKDAEAWRNAWEEEAQKLRADAERYRWILANAPPDMLIAVAWAKCKSATRTSDLSTAIDLARKAEP